MKIILKHVKTSLLLASLLLLTSGCSIPDREEEMDKCIKEKRGLSSKVVQACKVDPVFTDCAITEGDQVIGSGCTRKYKDKTEAEKEKICIDSVSDTDFQVLKSIIESCQDENSPEAIELQTYLAYGVNFILVALLIGTFFPFLSLLVPDDSTPKAKKRPKKTKPKKGSKTITVSDSRSTCNNSYTATLEDPKLSYVESGRFDWIVLNCRDIKNRQHICKMDYQIFFRELGTYYVKHYDSFKDKFNKKEVIALLEWAVSAIPEVYAQQRWKAQGDKRKASLLKFIESIENK